MALQQSLLCFKNISNTLVRNCPRLTYWNTGNEVTTPVHACAAVYSTVGPSLPQRPLLQSDAPHQLRLSQLLSSRGLSVHSPKKPLTSYFHFKKEFYPKLARTNPDRSVTDISKELGQQWRNLPQGQRQRYIEAAKEDSVRYKQEIDRLNTEQKEQILTEGVQRRKDRKALRLKRKLRDLHRPKRPATQYNLYVRERVTTRGTTPPRDFLRQVATEWRSMSAEQKQPYKLEAAELLKQYSVAMATWEEQMKAEGHPEVVRGYRVAKPRKRKASSKPAAKKAALRKKVSPKKKAASKKTKTGKKTTSRKSKKVEEPEDVSWMREE